MKKYLFKNDQNLYKANLHCHTTVSDGKMTPEMVKETYKKEGYSVVAFTDHDIMVSHPELADSEFLPLNGFEIEIDQKEGRDWQNSKTCHICFIGLDPENLKMPFRRDELYIWGNALGYVDGKEFDDDHEPIEHKYSVKSVNAYMKTAREKGFFVTYNHPHWSMETYSDYSQYEGMYAMEIYNNGCVVNGFNDYCPQVFDEMLRSGKKLYCIASDDNHSDLPKGTAKSEVCGGYVMISAESLDYKKITDALVNGDFYASNGAVIENVWYDTETKEIHVECKNAKRVLFQKGKRSPGHIVAEDGELMNEAHYPVLDNDGYVRITVYDENGKFAATQVYYVEDLNS